MRNGKSGQKLLLRSGDQIKLIIGFIFFIQIPVAAQVSITEAFPNLKFTTPVDIQHAGDRLFVVEQEGIIHVFQNSADAAELQVFLDISNKVKKVGEMGMLGLAFHPEYEKNGYFYVNYTTGEPDDRTIISRFQVTANPDSADVASEVRILQQQQPNINHNGGQLAFGPDGYLYIALGDGGGAGDPDDNAQSLKTVLGKILRIDVDSARGESHFSIPPDNPFRGNPDGYREEIYAYGLRNPWRFSFDFHTGVIWCADVGQGEWEEVNVIIPGGNYGWPFKEGKHCFDPSENCDTISGIIDPIWEYSHTIQSGSVTGGYVYRGNENPELFGKYIYADFMQNKIWALTYDSVNGPVNELIADAPGAITSFGVDEDQELYFCAFTSAGNKLYKFSSITDLNDNDLIRYEKEYFLFPAYPNPFNPSTLISYHIPAESYVKIDIFNTAGELVTTLREGIVRPGNHQVLLSAHGLASGMYLVSLRGINLSNSRTYTNHTKVILLK